MQEALTKWNQQGVSSHATDISTAGQSAALWDACDYPEDGLVLKLYVRDLPRESPESDATRSTFDLPWFTKDDLYNIDFVWFTKEEVKSLLLPNPQAGQRYALPLHLGQRLARFHLIDNALGESDLWDATDTKEVAIELIVSSVTDKTVYLLLEGVVRNEAPPKELFEPWSGTKTEIGRGIDLELFGDIEYNRSRQCFEKFDVLAAGMRWGATSFNHRFEDIGPAPLGFAFELASDAKIDRIPPRWIGSEYFREDVAK